MLAHLQEGDHVLITGGGSGQILKELDKLEMPLSITYVELSSAMIKMAQSKSPFKNLKVQFIHDNALYYNLPKVDVVITNYFLDVFTSKNLGIVMNKLDQALDTSGIWLYTDFRKTDSLFKNGLIKFMYLFFKIFSRLEANNLQDFEEQFEALGYRKIDTILYFGGMIESCAYQKPQLTK